MAFNHFVEFGFQNIKTTRTGRNDVLQVCDTDLKFLVLSLHVGHVDTAQLIQAALCNRFCLGFREVKLGDSGHEFISAQHRFELVTTGTCFSYRYNIINPVLCLDKTLQDVGSCVCLVEVKLGSAFNDRLTMFDVGVNHDGEGEQDGSSIQNAHHVGGVGFLQSA